MRNNPTVSVPNETQLLRPRGRQARVRISSADQQQLARLLATETLPPGHQRRVRVILLTAAGKGGAEIATEVGISRYHVSRVRARFGRTGIAGLADRPRVGRKSSVSPEMAEQVVAAAESAPPVGAERWTLSLLANRLGLSRSVVYRILRRGGRHAPASNPGW
jgi:transposase